MTNKGSLVNLPGQSRFWTFINSRLARKQLLFILLFSSIITLIGTAIQIYIEYRSDIQYIDVQFHQIQSAHLESLTSSLWELDEHQLHVQLNSILSLRDIVFIEILENDKTIFSAGDTRLGSNIVQKNYSMLRENKGIVENIGVLNAYASLENVHQRVFTRVLVILTTQGLKTFLVSLFILFVIHHLVIRHLIRISDYAQKLSLDELGLKLDLDKKLSPDTVADELDLLCKAVNNMRWRLIKDVKNLKQTEKALKESEQTYRTLVHTIPLGVQLTDLEGKILYSNPALHKIQGYADGELIGKFIWDLATDEATKSKIQSRYQMLIIKQPAPIVYFNRDTTRDGRFIDAQINWDYIHDANGELKGIISVISDVSHGKKLEAELRQVRKIESLGTLTGGIAHDFNNILGIIIGNTELAMEFVPEWHVAHDHITEIKAAGLRAAGIVKQLLSFSRRTDQELKHTQIIPIIEDILDQLHDQYSSTLAIRTQFLAERQTILGAPDQINQLVMNLCINASQAMEKKGGTLEILVDNVTLERPTTVAHARMTEGDYVKIRISDNGPGIEPDIIDKIFDPYFTTKAVGKGVGMGLAVAHGIVNNHHGAITVESLPGHGTAFEVLLPLTAEVAEVTSTQIVKNGFGNETILFVDDEPAIVKMVGLMLNKLGYSFVALDNPLEALSEFEKNPDRFDLVISDMTMPKMSGSELTEKLFDIRKNIPVVICTGHSSLMDHAQAKTMGIAAYLMKPIVREDLAKTVRQVLAKNAGI